MAKRKKKSKNYLALAIKHVFLGLFWLLKNIFLGIWWVLKHLGQEISKAFKKKKSKTGTVTVEAETEEVQEETPVKVSSTKKGKRKHSAVYMDFEILKDLKGEFQKFEDALFNKDSSIGIILGARGTGKSAIGMKLMENIHAKTGKPIYTMGFQTEDLPSWISNIENVDEVENGATLLLDESGITFSSRDSMSNVNKLLSNLLLIARHKDLNLVFITQNSSNIDLNIIRQADFLIMKPSSLLQKDFERKKINQIYKDADKHFKEYKEHQGLTYIYSEAYTGFINNPLPSFWTSNVSKAFRGQ